MLPSGTDRLEPRCLVRSRVQVPRCPGFGPVAVLAVRLVLNDLHHTRNMSLLIHVRTRTLSALTQASPEPSTGVTSTSIRPHASRALVILTGPSSLPPERSVTVRVAVLSSSAAISLAVISDP